MGQNQVKEKDPHESIPILPTEKSRGEEYGKKSTEFTLHRAAYLGDVEKVRGILDKDDYTEESIVRRVDKCLMTPLHMSAIGGSAKGEEIATLLLKHDESDPAAYETNFTNLTDTKGKTALHYAAASKLPRLIKILLDNGADVNIQDKDGNSPLHICATGNSEAAVDCIEVLLASKGVQTYEARQQDSRTVLHLAANAKAHKMVKYLLNKGFDHCKKDKVGLTPLHLAADAGDTTEAVACVKELLRVCRPDEVNEKTGDRGQTALHIAAHKCHQNVLKALLEDIKTDIWAIDKEKKTSLHWAVAAWYRVNSLSCVQLLVETPKLDDWHEKGVFIFETMDASRETAMEIAIKHQSIKIAEYLVQAHPTPEAWLDDSMMTKIYSILPEAMIPLMNNIGLTYHPSQFHERNQSILAEFGPVTGYLNPVEEDGAEEEGPPPTNVRQETKYLQNVLNAPKEIQRAVLLHPLVQIFIDLKWKKIRWMTWLTIIFQFVWLLLYTALVYEIYVPNCPSDNSTTPTGSAESDQPEHKKTHTLRILLSLGFASKDSSTLEDCDFDSGSALVFAVILCVLSVIIVLKEIFQLKTSGLKYFKDHVNYFQWALLIIFLINAAPAFQDDPKVSKWQLYLAALGTFVAWVLSLREVGKFPNCGIYAAILKQVFWHCLKMLVFYFPLLMAFALSLRILLPGKGQYTYLFFSIVKVVIMMTGELDFEDAFYDENGPNLALYAILGQFLMLLLVFITTIVLLNLLTGLAVNDVQSLMEEAEINRLSNELEQIYLLETLILHVRDYIGKDKFLPFMHSLNVTSVDYTDYFCFASKRDVEIKSYSPELKKTIRKLMVPDESM